MTMTRRSFESRLAAATLAGLLFSSIAAIEAAVAEPVEVTVLTSVALTSALDELAPQFERATGNKLKIGYSLIADIKKRVLAGETADVIMLSRPAMDDLQSRTSSRPAASSMSPARRSRSRCGRARRSRTSVRLTR
jgi:molybdate transport system substrate-binding protein